MATTTYACSRFLERSRPALFDGLMRTVGFNYTALQYNAPPHAVRHWSMTITSSKTGAKPTRHAPLVAPRPGCPGWLRRGLDNLQIMQFCITLFEIILMSCAVAKTERSQRVTVASHGSWKARRWPTSVRPPRAFCGPVLLGQLSNPHQLGVSKLSLESQQTQCGAKAADMQCAALQLWAS